VTVPATEGAAEIVSRKGKMNEGATQGGEISKWGVSGCEKSSTVINRAGRRPMCMRDRRRQQWIGGLFCQLKIGGGRETGPRLQHRGSYAPGQSYIPAVGGPSPQASAFERSCSRQKGIWGVSRTKESSSASRPRGNWAGTRGRYTRKGKRPKK